MIEFETLMRFGIALALVLALIAGLAWLGRRQLGSAPGGGRRLRVVESAAIDSRSRVVLVRRDEREHLILVHAGGATVVESGFVAPAETPQGKPS